MHSAITRHGLAKIRESIQELAHEKTPLKRYELAHKNNKFTDDWDSKEVGWEQTMATGEDVLCGLEKIKTVGDPWPVSFTKQNSVPEAMHGTASMPEEGEAVEHTTAVTPPKLPDVFPDEEVGVSDNGTTFGSDPPQSEVEEQVFQFPSQQTAAPKEAAEMAVTSTVIDPAFGQFDLEEHASTPILPPGAAFGGEVQDTDIIVTLDSAIEPSKVEGHALDVAEEDPFAAVHTQTSTAARLVQFKEEQKLQRIKDAEEDATEEAAEKAKRDAGDKTTALTEEEMDAIVNTPHNKKTATNAPSTSITPTPRAGEQLKRPRRAFFDSEDEVEEDITAMPSGGDGTQREKAKAKRVMVLIGGRKHATTTQKTGAGQALQQTLAPAGSKKDVGNAGKADQRSPSPKRQRMSQKHKDAESEDATGNRHSMRNSKPPTKFGGNSAWKK